MEEEKRRIKSIYRVMKNRCVNPNRHNYHRYGGRGIKVCDKWLNNIESFVEWSVKNGYKKGLQLDRIDNDGDYTPENCRWVTPKDNANNRVSNVFITYKNKTKSIAEWAEIMDIDAKTIYYRYSKGWGSEDLFLPARHINLEYNNQVKTLLEWAEITGISYKTIYYRYSKGWKAKDIIEIPIDKQVRITYNKETHTIKEWSKILNVSANTLHTRRHSGWTDKQIIEGKR